MVPKYKLVELLLYSLVTFLFGFVIGEVLALFS